MFFTSLTMNTFQGIVQLITVTLIFVFVLFITYCTTRYAANFKKASMSGNNLQVLETMSIATNKYLQIIKVGNRCFVIAVCKDNVTYLCDVDEESLIFTDNASNIPDFKTLLEKIKNNRQVSSNEKEDN